MRASSPPHPRARSLCQPHDQPASQVISSIHRAYNRLVRLCRLLGLRERRGAPALMRVQASHFLRTARACSAMALARAALGHHHSLPLGI